MLIASRYRVVKRLGVGAFGLVLEGMDTLLEREVAIKVVKRAALGSEQERDDAEKRFLREARAAARLHHPNIVTVYDTGKDGEESYLVMELVRGRTLRSLLDDKSRLPVKNALRTAGQLLKALDYAHKMGVVHRDIKPENIMVRDDGIIKIMDFGVAKFLRESGKSITQDGSVMGTPAYMAPEQITSNPVDGRTDIFSSSAILYEMLTGRHAFEATTIPSLFYKILSGEGPDFPEDFQIPSNIRSAILRGLALKPESRFQTGADFWKALAKGQAAMAEEKDVLDETQRRTVKLSLSPELAHAIKTPRKGSPAVRWQPPSLPEESDRSGELAATEPARLLLELEAAKVSGLLLVSTASWRMGVDLRHGKPVGASGGPPDTALGPMLRKTRFVDEANQELLDRELQTASDAGKRKRLGDIALRMGTLTPTQLLSVLEAQIEARIEILLVSEKGHFDFYPGLLTGEWSHMPEMDLDRFITRVLKKHHRVVESRISRLCRQSPTWCIDLTEDAARKLSPFELGPRVQRFLRLLPGTVLSEVFDATGMVKSDVELTLYLLLATGSMSLKRKCKLTPLLPPPLVATGRIWKNRPAISPKVEHIPQRIVSAPESSETARAKVERIPQHIVRKPGFSRPKVSRIPQRITQTRGSGTNVAKQLDEAQAALDKLNFDEAVRLLQQAQSLAPQNPDVLAKLGYSRFRQQPGDDGARLTARDLLEESLRLRPGNVDALHHLARVMRTSGWLEEARRRIDEALAIDPDRPDLLSEQAHIAKLLERRSHE